MTDYILITLALLIIWYLQRNRQDINIIKEEINWIQEGLPHFEQPPEQYYYVPYEKDSKKGKKKIIKKMYEDDEDIIYQEKKGGKVYHSKK
ncbi:hypothetical protein HOB10_00780 [Candidatus Parcubacteria bacterium]|jgi:hypothetical protein|nr:hypothetical protein [Candidatus Parcubacteria bacterium]